MITIAQKQRQQDLQLILAFLEQLVCIDAGNMKLVRPSDCCQHCILFDLPIMSVIIDSQNKLTMRFHHFGRSSTPLFVLLICSRISANQAVLRQVVSGRAL